MLNFFYDWFVVFSLMFVSLCKNIVGFEFGVDLIGVFFCWDVEFVWC